MADELTVVSAAAAGFYILAAAVAVDESFTKQQRKYRSKPWIIQRNVSGAYHSLFNDLYNTDEASFKNFMRMDIPAFEEVLSRVEFKLTKAHTIMRKPICPRERLCIGIRFLATGKLKGVIRCRPSDRSLCKYTAAR